MATALKAEALAWLRFGKRYPAVCTELKVYGGAWIPDVVGAGPTSVSEVEVKTDRNDLIKDFTSKSAKFFRYAKAEETGATTRVPNYFYYMVPVEMRSLALDVVKENLPNAGVLVHRPDFEVLPGRNLEVAKAAQRLHALPPSPAFLHEVFLRTSSELCGTRVALVGLKREIDGMLDRVDAAVVEQARRHAGGLDVEDGDADLDSRAAELAECVEGLEWRKLAEEARGKWRVAARNLLQARRWAPAEWHQALGR